MYRVIATSVLLVTSLWLAPIVAQDSADRDHQVERLAGLGKLWGDVKFFHPSLAYKDVDWDGSLVRAIPQVKAARTPEDYRNAIDAMLRALNDPETTTELLPSERPRPTASSSGPPQPEPTYFRVVDGVVVVSAVDGARALEAAGNPNARPREAEMLAEVARANGIVLDWRFSGVSPPIQPFILGFYLERAVGLFVQGPIRLGTERYRAHNGYPPQRGGRSGYSAGLTTDAPSVIVGEAKEQKPLAVLIDEQTSILVPVLSGLQGMGATIVQTGPSRREGGGTFRSRDLPDRVRVSLRVSAFVHPDGSSGFRPDVRIDAAGDDAVAAAIAVLRRKNADRTTRSSASPPPLIEQRDASYAQMTFPSEEYRLLALFRFWNVINYFYPYTHLADKPWATVLTDFIPRFMANTSALEYDRTVAEMVARLQDTHGSVTGLQELDAYLGTFAPPLRLASAGGKLTIVDLVEDAAASASGAARGDVIVAIDGEPVEQRVAALTALRALSTPQSAYAFIYPAVLRGARDSKVSLRVEGPGGDVRTVEVTRSVPLTRITGVKPRTTPIFSVMTNGYGYIDLARLLYADVNKALDSVMSTPAIIFDMRGYPNSTALLLLPRLTAKQHVRNALWRRPLQSGLEFANATDAPSHAFEQFLPPPAQGSIYTGKVVMLINEFAISQSEHMCLAFESATDVTFVGSPTTGADGDVTNLVLPGNIFVNFTAHDVRHADGRQLQRVGIQPHIKVESTPQGISEGRDEVLEAAIKHLNFVLQQ